jgi:hypothetical protein
VRYVCDTVQKKYKAPRRCTAAVVKLIRALLPVGHQFPPNIWTALRCGAESGRNLTHKEIPFCAQGIMPNRANRREVLCDKPTVFYGTYTDEQGVARSRTDLPNCTTCGHTGKKAAYRIPISQHIQVSITSPACPHAGYRTGACASVLTLLLPCAPPPVTVLLVESMDAQRPP